MSLSLRRRSLCSLSFCAALAVGFVPAATAAVSATAATAAVPASTTVTQPTAVSPAAVPPAPAGPPAAATASSDTAGWWFDAYGVSAVHAEGWTGAGVKVAVVDMQINPELPVFAGADLRVDPEILNDDGHPPVDGEPTASAAHGTNVTALIVGGGSGPVRGIAPDAEVTFYGTGPGAEGSRQGRSDDGLTETGRGIQRAIADGAQIVNVSLVTGSSEADMRVIAEAISRGAIVVAGSPNGTVGVTGFPGEYNGVVSVNAIDEAGELKTDDADPSRPNLHEEVTVVAPGVDIPLVGVLGQSWEGTEPRMGSSYATPLVTGMLAVAAQRYPEATGNQLIQALIRSTGGEAHAPERSQEDGYGYGVASLNGLLSIDPTTLPDENPLMDKWFGFPDEYVLQEVSGAQGEATAEPGVTDEPTGPTEPNDPAGDEVGGGGTTGIIVGALVILLAVVAVVTTVLVVSRRNRNRNPRSSDEGQR